MSLHRGAFPAALLLAAACGSAPGEGDIDDLIEQLQAQDPRERAAAASHICTLGEEGAPAVPALVVALKDAQRSGEPTTPFILALGKIGAPAREALVPFQELLRQRPEYRVQAALAVSWWLISGDGLTSVSILSPMLQQGDENEKLTAAACFAQIGTAASMGAPALSQALQDRSVIVRIEAARGLWSVARDARPVLGVLEAALKAPEASARRRAAQVLGEMGPAAAESAPALRELAEDPDDGVQTAAAKALKRVSD